MRRAVILYERADAEKSGVLINKYSAALKKRGCSAGLVIADRLTESEGLNMVSGADLIINRARDASLTKVFGQSATVSSRRPSSYSVPSA